jgi:hypothetical protein
VLELAVVPTVIDAPTNRDMTPWRHPNRDGKRNRAHHRRFARFLAVLIVSFMGWPGAWAAEPQWVPLVSRSPDGAAAIIDVEQLPDQLVISIRTPGFFLDEREVEGTVWSVLELPNGGGRGEPGSPMLPFHSIRVPIPHGLRLGAPEVTAQPAEVLQDVQIIPARPPEPVCDSCPTSSCRRWRRWRSGSV